MRDIIFPSEVNSDPNLLAGPLDATRAWSDSRITPEERRSFLEDTAAPDNLPRGFWVLAIYLPITVIGLACNYLSVHDERVDLWAYVDLVCSSAFLFVILYLRQHGEAIRWKRHLLIVFYLYNIGLMEAYYFSILPRFGETSYYTLGLLMMAVLIRLPPRQFLPLLLGCHAVYCLLLLHFASGDVLVAGFFNGTNAILLACLASWFLFNRDWETYEKGQIITQRNRALIAANAKLNEVMAIAAHDLRSPLASLLTYVDLLESEEAWSRAPYADALRDWHGILDGTLTLIGRMLHAHTAESRRGSLVIQSVDLVSLLQRSAAKLQYSASAKDIRLEIQAETGLHIQTVPETLDQVLDNLISNAVKFSPRQSRVLITAHRTLTTCEIAVEDAGPGIPPEEKSKLFSKFHRGRNLPTGGEASSGLGLFIVRQLMDSLGGTVSYEPAQFGGSLFRLRLPSKVDEQQC